MKVSRNWLQTYFDTPLPSNETLVEAITFHAFEVEQVTQVGNDNVFDIKVLGDRGHDCLSHRGIAKEIAAILNLSLALDPFAKKPNLAPETDEVAITVEDAAMTPRFAASYIKNVKISPSPAWLVERLEAIGQRSINNIVDATNFVMFNLGQPLHAYDAGKLNIGSDGKYLLVARRAREGEKLSALGGKDVDLAPSMLVIADGVSNEAIGIAGIRGGKPSGIGAETKNVVIESAVFDGPTIRKTAKALKLRTDASARFEQVLSPELAGWGIEAVTELILEIAGGEQVGYADVYPAPQVQTTVSVSVEKINAVLGTELTGAEVADAFARLRFGYKEENGVFTVLVPFERLDITIPEDLIEEVARIVGYEKIPATPLSALSRAPEVNSNFATAEAVREDFVSRGYSEIFTSVFVDKGERAVLNKVDSVKPFLRTTLVDSLAEALKKNIPNKDLLGLKEIKLFEIGSVWKGGKEIVMVGSVSEKEGAKEKPLSDMPHKNDYVDLPLSEATRYQMFSKFPYIVRDIALWVPGGVSADTIADTIKKEAGVLAVRVNLFDQFEKEGKVSYAFRIVFQSFERTLTEEEANAIMQKISAVLTQKGFEIR